MDPNQHDREPTTHPAINRGNDTPRRDIDKSGALHNDVDEALAQELGNISVEVAHALGSFLSGERPAHLELQEKSTPTDIVTQMDSLAESMARDMVAQRRPEDGFLGEEGARDSSVSGFIWIVDPIDGTTNYIYGLPMWAVSVAVVREGRSVAGCVYAPGLGMMVSAVRGAGARWHDPGGARSLKASAQHSVGEALIGTGFSYRPEQRSMQGRCVAEVIPYLRDIRRAGAASVDLCWVGAGLLDGYFEQGLHIWDFAAGALIVEEAGGVITTMKGESVWTDDVNGEERGTIIASAPGIHEQLRALLSQASPSHAHAGGE
jgi:myo-inositol-1(or 4)-monophosphatase